MNDSIPALVTTIPIGPSSSRAWAKAASTAPRSATSTSMPIALVPAGLQLGGGRLDPGPVPVEQRDGVPVGGELLGDAEPDARGRAGDDRDPAH